ncbi:hypothetical protein J4H64_18200 [Vibrio alginolyticus]|uniref:hypothetical protein n=1 Tax=Vibrio alginolyticus TaxID=663 RepID=UPI00063A83FC|nr:hypothetical protein [Vibrio alginolyticus]CDT99098.1 hypothetical protein VDIAB_40019 [Vibrio diabolicus]ELP3328921.1 hypothetical protein [Vibrio alginolyticus]MBS9907710.1 hypothetical protein [Vibrio alginolyticus]MBS9948348.1 hypothetical protein [Vibrio alginolyticus]MBS9985484.1 hypothetical protein [Vibrio alginolyticus]
MVTIYPLDEFIKANFRSNSEFTRIHGVVTDQLKEWQECCKLARDIRDVRHLVNVNDIDPMKMTQALCDEVLAVIAKLPRKANGY